MYFAQHAPLKWELAKKFIIINSRAYYGQEDRKSRFNQELPLKTIICGISNVYMWLIINVWYNWNKRRESSVYLFNFLLIYVTRGILLQRRYMKN